MRLFGYLIALSSIIFLSFNRQQHPLHREWQLVAERITHFNADHSPYEEAKDRLDSVKNVRVQFLPDGSFKSPEGNGSYTLSKDSIYLNLNGKKTSFKYELIDSKLTMESHIKSAKYLVRSRLYFE
ncbi:lipocalin-like domain-containing protein [Sphingobacterium faecale]|uniref:Uncharacterized protein n=1 Tax=Sphingobacterium faecale TaxID=2803775 RepID=A0ABS1R4H4_9SPHI|nr:lipocalin family protein [Sphingobacterium faecale]MBL1408731.1 hypothetical protein [Sphingobacterium faecale]